MQSYWLKFTDGTTACCQGQGLYDAKRIAEHLTGKTVSGGQYESSDPPIEGKPLPYPAEPSIWKFEHPVVGKTPSFCFRPAQCAGRTSCPQSRACDD